MIAHNIKILTSQKFCPPPPPFPLLQWFSVMKSSKKHVSNILFDLRRFLIQYNKTGYQLSNLCFYIILMITIILIMKTAAHIEHVINNLAKGHSAIVTLDVLLSFTCTCHFKSTTYDQIVM